MLVFQNSLFFKTQPQWIPLRNDCDFLDLQNCSDGRTAEGTGRLLAISIGFNPGIYLFSLPRQIPDRHIVAKLSLLSLTLWHHTTSPCHTCGKFYATQLVWRVIIDLAQRLLVCGTGSGVCDLTNRGRGLKETGAKVSDRGGTQRCSTGQDVFSAWSMWTYIVGTQNEMIILKMSITWAFTIHVIYILSLFVNIIASRYGHSAQSSFRLRRIVFKLEAILAA